MTTVIETCTFIYVVLLLQEESAETKKLKEARLAAYAAKKAKSKFHVTGVYAFLAVLLKSTQCEGKICRKVRMWYVTERSKELLSN